VASVVDRIQKDIFRLKKELTAARRALPPEPVRDYAFTGRGGESLTLSALFGERNDLLVLHNMGRSCSYCSLWADGLNGLLPHMLERAAFVLDSPNDWETQERFARERGWRFLMVTSGDSTFRRDMGFQGEDGDPYPGISAFHKSDDGAIHRVGSTWLGPGDDFCPVWPIFDLFPDGPAGWEPK